jgi:hypothetical protein
MTAQTNEVTRIHERIDLLAEKIDAMNQTMTRSIAFCEVCRPVVVGNGKPGIDKRVDRLEQRHANSDKWFWVLLGGVPTVISACVAMFARWLWR